MRVVAESTRAHPLNHHQPATAQFGLGRKKQGGTQFQDLQQQAQQQQADSPDNMDQLRSMFEDALNDPETQKYLETMGEQFGAALEQLAHMTPEEMQKQMADAMQMLADDSMVDNVIQQKDEILASLEASGTVPPEELARFKKDPAYFELKMRESFDQMKGLMTDPEYLKSMTEAMSGMQEMMGSEDGLLGGLSALMGGDLDDTQIEEARLELLSGKFNDNPMLKEMLESAEMKELLADPIKWRSSVKEGAEAGGARVGEL